MREQFVMPAKLKNLSYILLAVGVLSLVVGIFSLNGVEGTTRFWSVLVLNSILFLLIAVASTFMICAASLAQGCWHIAYRRVMEAISMSVPVLGVILFVVLMIVVFGHKNVYSWAQPGVMEADKILKGKSAFLNTKFFTVMTLLTLVVWSSLGWYIRKLSLQEDLAPKGSTRIYWRVIIVSAIFIVFYAVTISSSASWHWIMSLDPHWFSTLFGWYVFASSFVCGIAMLTLFVITLKKFGFLEWVNQEHMYDLGTMLFAFSIFWTYLWFAQFMLIWYGNIPEETAYFHSRMLGVYRPFFFLDIIVNFVLPVLILMSSKAKRNYTTLAFMSIVIFLGHYNDFFMMVMPGAEKSHWHLGWYEIGITAGFVGLMIFLVTWFLAKAPLYPKNHPLLKEAIIHQGL
ncbi:MAG: quinol:cytochrome C oxidoreductase [Chitinophagaceae bacterium]